MAASTKKRSGGVTPCHACSHRWGRHDGGIGRCLENGCACGSFVAAARRERPAQTPDRNGNGISAEEWRRFLERVERLFGSAWRARAERPTLNARGVSPLAALGELGLGLDATAPDVVRAFRRRALEVHPDHGGDPEEFKRLVCLRDAALAALEE